MIRKRGNTYSVVMRVPARYKAVEKRAILWVALGTESEAEAERLAPILKARQLAEWAEKCGERDQESPADRYRRLTDLAAASGFPLRSASEIAAGPIEDLVARAESLEKAGASSQDVTAAILGGVEAPPVMLSDLVAAVEALPSVQKDNRYKNTRQIRVWRNPRLRAVANLRAALKATSGIDDKPALALTEADARLHHEAWEKRFNEENIDPGTAKKDLDAMRSLLRELCKSLKRPRMPIYDGLKFAPDRHKKKRRKPQFSTDWIRETLIDPNPKLDGLNQEARDIILIALETGARQSEIHDLPPEDIHPWAEIPYVEIRHFLDEEEDDEDAPMRREVKNPHSIRKMPLAGLALEAARRNPQGFPRYRDKADFSATVNKYFRENGLFPTKGHTLGGLRHSWESRLRTAGLRLDDAAEMMGHSVQNARHRAVYGDEMDLQIKNWIATIIHFEPPGLDAERKAALKAERKKARRQLHDFWRRNQHLF